MAEARPVGSGGAGAAADGAVARAARVGKYVMLEQLGAGAFGKVRLAIDEHTGRSYAMKIMEKKHIQAHELTLQVRREIAVMKAMRHPHIVNLHEVLNSSKNLYMVMDLVTGGELFDAVAEQGRLPESTARLYFQQLVDGIHYCHSRHVYHRDLKPENLLLSANKQVLKITDFGLSSIKAQNASSELLHTIMGSPHYIAPEIITSAAKGYEGCKVDVWASAIILYGMLAGFLPFDEPNTRDLYQAIVHSPAQFPPHFSYDVVKLLRSMLQKDPNRRPTMDQVKEFAWFKVNYEPTVSATDSAPVVDDSSSNSKRKKHRSKRTGDRSKHKSKKDKSSASLSSDTPQVTHVELDESVRRSIAATTLGDAKAQQKSFSPTASAVSEPLAHSAADALLKKQAAYHWFDNPEQLRTAAIAQSETDKAPSAARYGDVGDRKVERPPARFPGRPAEVNNMHSRSEITSRRQLVPDTDSQTRAHSIQDILPERSSSKKGASAHWFDLPGKENVHSQPDVVPSVPPTVTWGSLAEGSESLEMAASSSNVAAPSETVTNPDHREVAVPAFPSFQTIQSVESATSIALSNKQSAEDGSIPSAHSANRDMIAPVATVPVTAKTLQRETVPTVRTFESVDSNTSIASSVHVVPLLSESGSEFAGSSTSAAPWIARPSPQSSTDSRVQAFASSIDGKESAPSSLKDLPFRDSSQSKGSASSSSTQSRVRASVMSLERKESETNTGRSGMDSAMKQLSLAELMSPVSAEPNTPFTPRLDERKHMVHTGAASSSLFSDISSPVSQRASEQGSATKSPFDSSVSREVPCTPRGSAGIFKPMTPGLAVLAANATGTKNKKPSMSPSVFCPEFSSGSEDGQPKWCIDSMDVFADVEAEEEKDGEPSCATPGGETSAKSLNFLEMLQLHHGQETGGSKSIFAPLNNKLVGSLAGREEKREPNVGTRKAFGTST